MTCHILLLTTVIAIVQHVAKSFVINLLSEEDLALAIESYPVLVVHLHRPTDDESRTVSNMLRQSSKELIPRAQLASVNILSEGFQNFIETVDDDTSLLMYIDGEPIPPLLNNVLKKAISSDDFVKRTVALFNKLKRKKKVDQSAVNDKIEKQKKAKNAGDKSRAPSKVAAKNIPTPRPKPKAKKVEAADVDPILVEPKSSAVTFLTFYFQLANALVL